MKLIHTADLHLGKRMNDISLLQDQIKVLGEILSIAKEEQADALLIAGDVYQQAAPSAEAMTAFNEFLTRLSEAGIQAFIISGNHDSDQRISYFSGLIRRAGIYVSERFDGQLQPVRVTDAYGDVVIHLLPFIRPIQVRRCYPDEAVESYEDAMRLVLQHSELDPQERNVLLCHQFITGASPAGSEEEPLAVGGLDNISASLLDGFDYVALGHIHGAQRVGRDTVRYAGSPLKYSFSEAHQTKSVTVIELGPKGQLAVRQRPLHQPHEVREIEGYMADLMNGPYTEDYVRVTVHDELVPPDARITLSAVYPNMMKFAVQNAGTQTEIDVQPQGGAEDKSVAELFADFYRLQNGAEPDSRYQKVLSDILKELEDMSDEAD